MCNEYRIFGLFKHGAKTAAPGKKLTRNGAWCGLVNLADLQRELLKLFKRNQIKKEKVRISTL